MSDRDYRRPGLNAKVRARRMTPDGRILTFLAFDGKAGYYLFSPDPCKAQYRKGKLAVGGGGTYRDLPTMIKLIRRGLIHGGQYDRLPMFKTILDLAEEISARVAQEEERRFCKPKRGASSASPGSIFSVPLSLISNLEHSR